MLGQGRESGKRRAEKDLDGWWPGRVQVAKGRCWSDAFGGVGQGIRIVRRSWCNTAGCLPLLQLHHPPSPCALTRPSTSPPCSCTYRRILLSPVCFDPSSIRNREACSRFAATDALASPAIESISRLHRASHTRRFLHVLITHDAPARGRPRTPAALAQQLEAEGHPQERAARHPWGHPTVSPPRPSPRDRAPSARVLTVPQQPAVGRGEPRADGGAEGQPDEDHGAQDALCALQRRDGHRRGWCVPLSLLRCRWV